VAATDSVIEPPAATVCPWGWVVMAGAAITAVVTPE
jgi:hypothetical protein